MQNQLSAGNATAQLKEYMTMTYKEYRAEIQQTFAKYGFIECPLLDQEIGNLHQMGASIDQAYEIGCDIANGVEADTAFDRNLNHCEVLA